MIVVNGRQLKRISLFSVAIVLVCSLAAPVNGYAQSDERIVMRCTYDGYNNQTLDFVIDLAAKTVSLTHTIEISGSQNVVQSSQPNLTQVTDDQITWASSNPDGSTSTDTLNRYTGQVVEHVIFQGGNLTNVMSCHWQQKQF